MKMFIKNSYLFLIFLFLLLSKNFFYGLMTPIKEIDLKDAYIKKLEQEIQDIDLIKDYNYEISGVYGKVLYQNPYKSQKEVIILANTDNIKLNDYVISSDGLIGIVSKVYQKYFIAKLLINPKVMIQVKINDCYGILKFNETLYVDNISNYCNVKENDEVYTSNLGYFDEPIIVGKVNRVIKDKNEINHLYEIIPSANFNHLNYVVILTGVNK